MGKFRLPINELYKLRKYKKKLIGKRRALENDISHEAIAKSSGIDQILRTLSDIENPKQEAYGYEEFGGVITPLYDKPKTFKDVMNIASEYDISLEGFNPPKEKTTTAEELKSRNFLEKWDIEYDESLKPKANIEAASKQVWPHKLNQFQNEANELFGKPMTGDEYKAKRFLEKWGVESDSELDHKANVIAGYDIVEGEDKEVYLDEANSLFEKDKKDKPRLSEQKARNKLNSAVIKINKLKSKVEEGLARAGDEKELAFITRKFNEWLEFIPEEDRETYLQDIGEGIPEGAKPTGKYSQGKPVYVLPDGRGWIPD